MTMIVSARRRQADDLERLLSGGRASTARAAQDLAPLADLVRNLVPAQHAPSADFRSALRARLVAEATARVPAPAVPAQQARPGAPARVRQAVAAVALASVVTGAGAAVASTQALPGDPLYGLKRQIENIQLDLARGDLGHGREHLQQADARLAEAEALTASEHGSDAAHRALVMTALDEMDAAVVLGVDELNKAYRETGDDEPLLVLDRFVTEQRERLADLMQLLDPSLRARAETIAERLAVVERQVSALLGFPVDSARAFATDLTASGDGWAVGRLVDRAGATATGTTAALDDGGLGARGERTSSGSGVEDVVDAVGGDTTATPGGTGPIGGVVDGVIGGGGTTTGPQAPIASAPVPSVSVPQPLPTPPPVVTDPVGSATSAVPLPPAPTAPACVPLPPLTSC